MRKYAIVALSVVCLSACATKNSETKTDLKITPQSGYAQVNGINIYYEVYGKGEGVPLVLLHGGGSTIDVTFSKVIPFFAQHRKVIAIEEQGHGRTSNRNAPIRFETSADDMVGVLNHLNIEKADVLGFSNGASVALQMAIRHPHKVNKLVFASAFTKKSGTPSWFWPMMKKADFANMPQPLKDAFLRVNPDPEKLKMMHDKDLERIQNFKDVSDKDVKNIKASTLILIGDKDVVTPEHAIELTHLIKNSRLLIVPGGHGDYLGEIVMTKAPSKSPELVSGLIEEFLGNADPN